jgi:peptidoglycan/LPS O-acetylase OafA/YrhL
MPEGPEVETEGLTERIHEEFEHAGGTLLKAIALTTALFAALAAVAANPATVSRLRPLAAIGQMSLTTYLTQTLISVTLFYPFGFGLYGHATLLQIFAIAIVVFSLQMAASLWWLKRYRFGPMEWLWRSIAYLEWQPRRREPAATPSVESYQQALDGKYRLIRKLGGGNFGDAFLAEDAVLGRHRV